MFNTTCILHGQYVIYYNERLNNILYPEDYSEFADSYLCEVEVYGECPSTFLRKWYSFIEIMLSLFNIYNTLMLRYDFIIYTLNTAKNKQDTFAIFFKSIQLWNVHFQKQTVLHDDYFIYWQVFKVICICVN